MLKSWSTWTAWAYIGYTDSDKKYHMVAEQAMKYTDDPKGFAKVVINKSVDTSK